MSCRPLKRTQPSPAKLENTRLSAMNRRHVTLRKSHDRLRDAIVRLRSLSELEVGPVSSCSFSRLDACCLSLFHILLPCTLSFSFRFFLCFSLFFRFFPISLSLSDSFSRSLSLEPNSHSPHHRPTFNKRPSQFATAGASRPPLTSSLSLPLSPSPSLTSPPPPPYTPPRRCPLRRKWRRRWPYPRERKRWSILLLSRFLHLW